MNLHLPYILGYYIYSISSCMFGIFNTINKQILSSNKIHEFYSYDELFLFASSKCNTCIGIIHPSTSITMCNIELIVYWSFHLRSITQSLLKFYINIINSLAFPLIIALSPKLAIGQLHNMIHLCGLQQPQWFFMQMMFINPFFYSW